MFTTDARFLRQNVIQPQLLSQHLNKQMRALALDIENAPDTLPSNTESTQYFTQKYILTPIMVDWDSKKITTEKRTVSAYEIDPVTALRSGASRMHGQSITREYLVYKVPCTGNLGLFWLAPSSNILASMPKLTVFNDSINFEVALNEHDPDVTQREIDYYITCINRHTSSMNNDIIQFNTQLCSTVTRLYENKIQKNNIRSEILNRLGITLDQNTTEPAPVKPAHSTRNDDMEYLYSAISYGGTDLTAATMLNGFLKANGVKTWFYPDDGLPGEKLHRMMSTMISKVDRIILLCSRASLQRTGVLNELEMTLERESSEGGSVRLIPIALDNYVIKKWSPERPDLAIRMRGRNIFEIDVKNFESEATQKQLNQLLLALKKTKGKSLV